MILRFSVIAIIYSHSIELFYHVIFNPLIITPRISLASLAAFSRKKYIKE